MGEKELMHKKDRKRLRQREVIREGEEVISGVEGFMAGMFFFIFKTIGFDYDIPIVSPIFKGLAVLTGIIAFGLLLDKIQYETWIPVKYLATFVLSYSMLRILFTGSVF
jgi:hypothetical protein